MVASLNFVLNLSICIVITGAAGSAPADQGRRLQAVHGGDEGFAMSSVLSDPAEGLMQHRHKASCLVGIHCRSYFQPRIVQFRFSADIYGLWVPPI
jgi:hypothetical protein